MVIQPLFTGPEHADVAVQVEQSEGVAVLEHRRALASARGGRQDVELILNLDYVFHDASVSKAIARAAHCTRRYTSRYWSAIRSREK